MYNKLTKYNINYKLRNILQIARRLSLWIAKTQFTCRLGFIYY